jgi:hypothetical protein
MPSALQKILIGEELLTAMRLLKTGLRELNRMKGSTDFFHLPILLLASGFERMMKTVVCCHHLKETGEFPKRSVFQKGRRGHDLVVLLKHITQGCFSDDYLARIPAAKADIEFLRNDPELSTIIQILSDFGQSARYYNLNVVLAEPDSGPSPDDEWQKLEMEVLQKDRSWTSRIEDPKQSDAIHGQINRELTVRCEKLARALARLFTIGGLGSQAKQISPHTYHFLSLRDDQLGKTDYESIHI